MLFRSAEVEEKVYRIRLETLGENHPDTQTVMYNLGISYKILGQYQKALELYEKLYRIRSSSLGLFHADTLKVKNSILDLQKKLKNS